MSELRPLDMSLHDGPAESCVVGGDVITTGTSQSDYLVISPTTESTFYLDTSAPTTPFCTTSTNSSFVISGPSSVSVSSCSSPTTELYAAGASIEPRMPRLSEEFCSDDSIDDATISISNARPAPLNMEKAFSSGPTTDFDFSHHEYSPRPDLTAFNVSYVPGERNLKQSFEYQSSEVPTHRRHRSGDSSSKNSISSKFFSGFMRKRHRKNSSQSTNPTVDTARTALSSRSSSFTSEHKNEIGFNTSETSLQNPNWSGGSPPASPYNHFTFSDSVLEEPIERSVKARAPLLPPPNLSPSHREDKSSPVHSPNLAEFSRGFSRLAVTQVKAPMLSHEYSPSLVQRSPISPNFPIARKTATAVDSIPAFMLPMQDEWSMSLGHANFTIYPEPYLPAIVDLEAWRQLNKDRDIAHAEFCRHQARTLEHYGPNSKTFKLTEAKWGEIDTKWKSNLETAYNMMRAKGVRADHLSATTITSYNVRMPTLNPHDGKMPKLGDQEIVGPMAQSPPIQGHLHSPTRKAHHAKRLDFKLGHFFSKTSVDER